MKETLKLALEALEYHTEQTRPIHQTSEAITAIKEALAQPAQEPWPEEPFGHMAGGVQPPQRPWVGLTDKEAQLIYDMGQTPTGMMEMVEAMLKGKNT